VVANRTDGFVVRGVRRAVRVQLSMKALGLLLSLGLIASSGKVVSFDQSPPGKTPPGWTVAMTNGGARPEWVIRADQTAPTGGRVLAQVSNDATRNRYPLAIFNGINLLDGDLSVRMKPISGRQDRAGGLVWRYRDPNNYYLVRANALEKNVAIFKVRNGLRTQIQSGVRRDIPSDAWSILKVSVRGDRFQVYVNHRRILEAWDSTFQAPGRVGLWTGADSITYFDDFRINPK
jgi:hypothetical protein